MLEPTIPPPMITTSAECTSHVYVDCVLRCRDEFQEVIAASATRASTTTANHPNTTANAVPRLTLLMQAMPIAVRDRVQRLKTSKGVSNARSTGEPSGPIKYPGLVAAAFSMLNPSPLTPASSDTIPSIVPNSCGSLV